MITLDKFYKNIDPVNKKYIELGQKHFDNLIKPIGSLAKLEKMVSKFIGILKEENPVKVDFPKKLLVVCVNEKQEEYLDLADKGLLPISVIATSINSDLSFIANEVEVVDTIDIIKKNVNEGYLEAQNIVKDQRLIGLGSSSTCEFDLKILEEKDPEKVLLELKDSEINKMVGMIFYLADNDRQIMIDGVKSSLAMWIAGLFNKNILDYGITSHISTEKYHKEILDVLNFEPVLQLDLTKGDCEGAALAMTLFEAGLKAYKEMDTFESAGVHTEVEDFSHSKNK